MNHVVSRVDRAQENLHFLMDICEQTLYILETEEAIEVGEVINQSMLDLHNAHKKRRSSKDLLSNFRYSRSF